MNPKFNRPILHHTEGPFLITLNAPLSQFLSIERPFHILNPQQLRELVEANGDPISNNAYLPDKVYLRSPICGAQALFRSKVDGFIVQIQPVNLRKVGQPDFERCLPTRQGLFALRYLLGTDPFPFQS